MDPTRALPALTVAIVALLAVLSGPVGPLDLTRAADPCSPETFPGDGNATVTVDSIPERATLSKSDFGAAVYRLAVPTATVNIADVDGRPTVSYRIHVDGLERTVGSTKILSHCTTGSTQLSIDRSTFSPDEVEKDRYDATIYVVYRGVENGTNVERTLVERNVTVEVRE